MVQDKKRGWTQLGWKPLLYESFSERWRCVNIVNITLIQCSSIWIHKVAVYDILVMAISWGAQTIGLIMGGRVDKVISWIYGVIYSWLYAICNIHGQFHSPTFTAHHVHTLLSWNFSARKANLGRDNNARIRSLRIEIDQLTRMCSQR
jgi:hypothetical protein